MRAAEVTPKYKNYSQTKSLDYRIAHVVGVHNLGSCKFYAKFFDSLRIPFDSAIDDWFSKLETH